MTTRDVGSYLALTDNIGNKLTKLVDWFLAKLPIKSTSRRKASIVLNRLIQDIIDENRMWIVEWLRAVDPNNREITERSKMITATAPVNKTISRSLATVFPLLLEMIPQIWSSDESLDIGREFSQGIVECAEFCRLLSSNSMFDTELVHLASYATALVEDFDASIAIRDKNAGPPPNSAPVVPTTTLAGLW